MADPPETPRRRLARSSGWSLAAASTAPYMVGTPMNTSTACSRTVCAATAGSKRGINARLAPMVTGAMSAHVRPKTWNSGRQPSTVSPCWSWINVSATVSALVPMFRWVSWAPLGRPVVPEV